MELKNLNQFENLAINGNLYKYPTDFRFFTRFSNLVTNNANQDEIQKFLSDVDLPIEDKSITAIIDLYFPPKPKVTKKPKKMNYVMKYDVLEELIFSSFYLKYNIDLEEIEFLHFEKFRKLLNETKGTKLEEVLRAWGEDSTKANKDRLEYIQNLRDTYDLSIPEKTPEQKKAEYDEKVRQSKLEMGLIAE